MNVSLSSELEELIEAELRSGMYENAAAVREGLRLLEERDDRRRALTDELQRSVRDGLAQARRGKRVWGSGAAARIQALIEETD